MVWVKNMKIYSMDKSFFFYFVYPFDTGLKWHSWLFRVFNLNYKNSNYNERGFRIFGFTFIWTKN
jgi:hypothetical protein